MSEGLFGMQVERNVDMPMRDGVLLRANVFRPECDGPFPGLLLRTPYGKPEGGSGSYVSTSRLTRSTTFFATIPS